MKRFHETNMERKSVFCVLIFWIFPILSQAEIDLTDSMTSEAEVSNCNCVALESILESIRRGNELLNQRFIQLDKQHKQWQNLNVKLDNLALSLQAKQNKDATESKDHLGKVMNSIHEQYQSIMLRLPAPAGDGRWEILMDIKETLKSHNTLYERFDGKVKGLENDTNKLKEITAKNTQILEKLEDNLKNIEIIVIKHNEEKNTEKLKESVEKNFQVLEKIQQKLKYIGSTLESNKTQLANNQNLEKYIKQNESLEMCLKTSKCIADLYPTNCAGFNEKFCSNSTCYIYNDHFGPKPFVVSCDNKSEGGGWTVIQRRINGSVDFYRNWSDYKTGFGDITGEFFIGLDKLHSLTTTLKPVELMIQLKDFNNITKFAKYDEFEVGSVKELYKLKRIGNYSGDAGNCFEKHQGFNFSTKDRNNELNGGLNCAVTRKAGWWYDSCGWSNLNGEYSSNPFVHNGIYWCSFHGYNYSLKYVQMSIRPQQLNDKK